jgi:hypothetical protein
MTGVYRRVVLWRAWPMVRSNNGAPGIDKTTLAQVEEYEVTRLPAELASDLRGKWYRPVRRHPRQPETLGNLPVAGTRLDQLSRSEPHPLTLGPFRRAVSPPPSGYLTLPA